MNDLRRLAPLWILAIAASAILLSPATESAAHEGMHDHGPRVVRAEPSVAGKPSLKNYLRGTGRAATGDASPAAGPLMIQATVNSPVLEAGQQLVLGLSAQSPAGSPPADLYVGVLLPDGETIVFFSAPGVVGGSTTLDRLWELRPMQAALPGVNVSLPTFLQFTVPAGGIPAGTYQYFAALMTQGALAGGSPDADAVIALDVTSFSFLPPNRLDPSVSGQWSVVLELPLIPIHLHMLPTGHVLLWPGDEVSGDNAMLWVPTTGVVIPARASSGFDMFCSGHSFLADGRLLVTGGSAPGMELVGITNAAVYDPFANSWRAIGRMNAPRWYPTNTTLSNGDVLVTSGTIDITVGGNRFPQVFEIVTDAWRDLLAEREMPDYPYMFLAPGGHVFSAGPEAVTRYLDTAGVGSWSDVATSNFGLRIAGSAVLYDTGQVLLVGGGLPPTRTAEVINLTTPFPSWRYVMPMTFARQTHNATLLPDGTVLVTGGTSGPMFNDPTLPVFTAELWNPATETWSMMADANVPRLYHSAALLLPDGRVMTTGGNFWGGHRELEIFTPPYLFRGPRPTLTAPSQRRLWPALLRADPGRRQHQPGDVVAPGVGHAWLRPESAIRPVELLRNGHGSQRAGPDRSQSGPARSLHAVHPRRRRRPLDGPDRPHRVTRPPSVTNP